MGFSVMAGIEFHWLAYHRNECQQVLKNNANVIEFHFSSFFFVLHFVLTFFKMNLCGREPTFIFVAKFKIRLQISWEMTESLNLNNVSCQSLNDNIQWPCYRQSATHLGNEVIWNGVLFGKRSPKSNWFGSNKKQSITKLLSNFKGEHLFDHIF